MYVQYIESLYTLGMMNSVNRYIEETLPVVSLDKNITHSDPSSRRCLHSTSNGDFADDNGRPSNFQSDITASLALHCTTVCS
jgi:hypothetical protein